MKRLNYINAFAGTFDGTATVGTEILTSNGFDNSYIASWK